MTAPVSHQRSPAADRVEKDGLDDELILKLGLELGLGGSFWPGSRCMLFQRSHLMYLSKRFDTFSSDRPSLQALDSYTHDRPLCSFYSLPGHPRAA